MRILVVEDEKKVALLLQGGLAEHRIEADICHNGDDALELLSHGGYDGAVLDIMLPGRDGLSVLKRLRASGNPIPVLLLTARGDLEERVEGLNLGADDYLAKPFAMAELIARVRAICRRRMGIVGNVLSYADLTMNLGTRTVERAGRILALTPREFSLLECLLKSTEKVVSRTELTQQVWGYQFDPGTNVVDVAVQRLRRKLEDGATAPLIHTVRGVGYTLRERL